jgi:hypothetical protein
MQRFIFLHFAGAGHPLHGLNAALRVDFLAAGFFFAIPYAITFFLSVSCLVFLDQRP